MDRRFESVTIPVLREVVVDRNISPEERLAAAEELLALGGPDVALAAEGIRAVVADLQTPFYTRDVAVPALLALGGPHVAAAAEALRAVVAAPDVFEYNRESAAKTLVDLGEPYGKWAVEALVQALGDRRTDGIGEVAKMLAVLGPAHTDDAAQALRERIRAFQADEYEWCETVEALAGLGSHCRDEALHMLTGMLTAPGSKRREIDGASWTLARLSPGHVLLEDGSD